MTLSKSMMVSSSYHCDNGGFLTVYSSCSLCTVFFFLWILTDMLVLKCIFTCSKGRKKREVKCEYFENLFSFSYFIFSCLKILKKKKKKKKKWLWRLISKLNVFLVGLFWEWSFIFTIYIKPLRIESPNSQTSSPGYLRKLFWKVFVRISNILLTWLEMK